MAMIKAKAEITIFNVKDVKSVTRYYLLQSSTVTAPAKPTTINPGGNWKTTEPYIRMALQIPYILLI